jgi:PhoPQ-activated pathogenicity-related protein
MTKVVAIKPSYTPAELSRWAASARNAKQNRCGCRLRLTVDCDVNSPDL